MNRLKIQRPVHVLLVKRIATESTLREIYNECISFLLSKSCTVYIEDSEPRVNNTLIFQDSSLINLIITLGGDGTVIWAVNLFKDGAIPPVIAFNLGSLGFMTKFPPSSIIETLGRILSSDTIMVETHSRLKYTTVDSEYTFTGFITNEICIDRGASGNVIELEIYLGGEYCTTAVGDGLLIATPCGSTAYSLSAGGSIVHYGIPAILITPICPHSLSFRPLVVPNTVDVTIKIPTNSRLSGWINIDGHTKLKANLGSTIHIQNCEYGIPYVILEEGYSNWVCKLRDILGWNDRHKQKSINFKPTL